MSGKQPRWLRWLGTVSLKQLAMGATVLVVLASGVFGGLEKAAPAAVTQVEVGTAVDTGPVTITVTGPAEVLETETSSGTVERRLVVRTRVTNGTDRSVYGTTLADVVRVHGDDERPELVVIDDGSSPAPVGPGITLNVAFGWLLEPGATAPSTVDVSLRSHTWRRSSIDQQWDWWDATETARVSLGVS